MTTKLLQRRLERLKLVTNRPVVVEMTQGESLAQVRRRARVKHDDLTGRDLVIIERTGAEDVGNGGH